MRQYQSEEKLSYIRFSGLRTSFPQKYLQSLHCSSFAATGATCQYELIYLMIVCKELLELLTLVIVWCFYEAITFSTVFREAIAVKITTSLQVRYAYHGRQKRTS